MDFFLILISDTLSALDPDIIALLLWGGCVMSN